MRRVGCLTEHEGSSKTAERDIADALGLMMEIAPGRGEAGEIIIGYRSLDQFETVRKKLMGV